MRFTLLTILIASTAALPMLADDLSFTLNSNIGTGYVPANPPDAFPPCLEPGCVPFSGTLLDNDTDGSFIFLSNADPSLTNIGVIFSSGPAAGGLTVDDTFDDLTSIPGVLIGDPTDSFGTGLPYTYSGPLFGIDIAPGTTPGDYSGVVTIYANGGTNDPNNLGFSVTQPITVDVLAAEPATACFALAGLAALGACYGLRRQWRSSAPSH